MAPQTATSRTTGMTYDVYDNRGDTLLLIDREGQTAIKVTEHAEIPPAPVVFEVRTRRFEVSA